MYICYTNYIMCTLELKVYEIFKSKFSEQEAATVIEYIETKTKERVEENTEIFKTLQTKDLETLRREIHTVFSTKTELKDEIHRLELQLYNAIFWSGLVQVLVVLGGLLAIVKFMLSK